MQEISSGIVAANNNDEFRFYVYAWQYPDGRTFYVGKGCGRRAEDDGTRCRNRFFKSIVAKIRREGGEPRIVRWREGLREEDAHRLEIAYINLFGRRDIGTGILCNLTDGGEGVSNPSDETRAKLSEAVTRRFKDPAERAKHSNAMRGKTRSVETRAKMSSARAGVPKSSEHRANISAAHAGLKRSQEARDRMTTAQRMRPPSKANKTGFKGVHIFANTGNYGATINIGDDKRYLGTFPTPEEAARAYDAAVHEFWGRGPWYLNFPEWRLDAAE